MEDNQKASPKTPKIKKIEAFVKSIYTCLRIQTLNLLIGSIISLNYRGASLHVDKLLVICDRLNGVR